MIIVDYCIILLRRRRHSRAQAVKDHSRNLSRDIRISGDRGIIKGGRRIVRPGKGDPFMVSKYEIPGNTAVLGEGSNPIYN